MTKKPIKIEFAPGCFDDLDVTQEELDEIVEMLSNMDPDELLANGKLLTDEDIDELPDFVKEQLISSPTRIVH